MMPYTRQQITGGPSFNSSTRVGNWNEDLVVEEERQRKLLQMEASGELLTQKIDRKFQNHLAPEKLVPERETNDVQFGEPLLLFNEETKAFVSVDLDARLHHIKERFAVSGANSDGPIRRNTFVLERYEPKKRATVINSTVGGRKTRATLSPPQFYDFDANPTTLHYGQYFRIRVFNDEFNQFGSALYLRSQRQTPEVCAPVTRSAQEVSVDAQEDFGAVWKVEYRDPKLRLDYEGTPVRGNYPLCIVHAQTGEMLCSTKQASIRNDFGREYEICAKTNRDTHRVESESNVFYFVVGGMKREQQQQQEENNNQES